MLNEKQISERMNDKNASWYFKNREKINSRRREEYASKKSKIREYQQAYRQKHYEKLLVRDREYNRKNKKVRNRNRRVWSIGPRGRFSMYVQSSKARKIEFVVTFEQFCELGKNPCDYCGEPGFFGMDRVENSIGYRLENVVPCCKKCNYAKHTNTRKDFITMCHRVAQRHSL